MNKTDALLWLKENPILFMGSYRHSNKDLEMIYKVYNLITGESKKPSSCGKCLKNTLDRLKAEYNKIEEKYIGYIYQTTKNKLTLNPCKEIAFKFLVSNEDELKERFEILNKSDDDIQNKL